MRNVTRVYDYALDRYNTLSSGTTDPVTMTVGRSRAFIHPARRKGRVQPDRRDLAPAQLRRAQAEAG